MNVPYKTDRIALRAGLSAEEKRRLYNELNHVASTTDLLRVKARRVARGERCGVQRLGWPYDRAARIWPAAV